ncbi:MAG: hypothetical protein ACE1S7_05280 [Candidatus Tisiphia sp.]
MGFKADGSTNSCIRATTSNSNTAIGGSELLNVFVLASITMLRVVVLIILAAIIWISISIYVGLNPKVTAIVQPLAQFFAAFPTNLLFPIVFIIITRYDLNPNIWLSPLMIMGAQWYILFNVIVGASTIPNELKDATKFSESVAGIGASK